MRKSSIDKIIVSKKFVDIKELERLEILDLHFEILAQSRAYKFEIVRLENELVNLSQTLNELENKLHAVYTGKRFKLGHWIITVARKILFLK